MTRSVDPEILRLALPAFLALVAEPLFLLADAAIAGHLGTVELAALGVLRGLQDTRTRSSWPPGRRGRGVDRPRRSLHGGALARARAPRAR